METAFRHTCCDAAKSLTKKIATHSSATSFPKPKGDIEHYIFSVADKPIIQPGIYLYEVTNSTYSFDSSNRGLEQFYLFDETGDCITEFSRGITPFKEEPISLERPVAILSVRRQSVFRTKHMSFPSR